MNANYELRRNAAKASSSGTMITKTGERIVKSKQDESFVISFPKSNSIKTVDCAVKVTLFCKTNNNKNLTQLFNKNSVKFYWMVLQTTTKKSLLPLDL